VVDAGAQAFGYDAMGKVASAWGLDDMNSCDTIQQAIQTKDMTHVVDPLVHDTVEYVAMKSTSDDVADYLDVISNQDIMNRIMALRNSHNEIPNDPVLVKYVYDHGCTAAKLMTAIMMAVLDSECECLFQIGMKVQKKMAEEKKKAKTAYVVKKT
jgi:hypothetical protein